jgi:hypothetical protein
MEPSMSLSQAMSWVGVIPAEPEAADGVRTNAEAVHACVRMTEGVLSRRGQWAEVAQDRSLAPAAINPARFTAMLAHAICEVSALAQGQTCIRIRTSAQGIAISGRNPVVLPEDRLQVDDLLRLRCFALGVPVALFWEQGTGPCLVLYAVGRR